MLTIREASRSQDSDAVWTILEPVIRAGETYALPRDWTREAALAYWFSDGNIVFVAEDEGAVIGTYFLHPNQKGGGSHVSNCGYINAAAAFRPGIARPMWSPLLGYAQRQGVCPMQINFVGKSNVT